MPRKAPAPSATIVRPTGDVRVTAPFAGFVTFTVSPGDTVEAGAVVATIEAMKLEAGITAPAGGTVSSIAVGAPHQVEGGDVLVEIC